MNYFLKIDQSDLDKEMQKIKRKLLEIDLIICKLQDMKAVIDEAYTNLNILARNAEMEVYENEE